MRKIEVQEINEKINRMQVKLEELMLGSAAQKLDKGDVDIELRGLRFRINLLEEKSKQWAEGINAEKRMETGVADSGLLSSLGRRIEMVENQITENHQLMMQGRGVVEECNGCKKLAQEQMSLLASNVTWKATQEILLRELIVEEGRKIMNRLQEKMEAQFLGTTPEKGLMGGEWSLPRGGLKSGQPPWMQQPCIREE